MALAKSVAGTENSEKSFIWHSSPINLAVLLSGKATDFIVIMGRHLSVLRGIFPNTMTAIRLADEAPV